MKIKKSDRVVFKRNPIKEIIGQISFPPNMEIQADLPVEFQKSISEDFPLFESQASDSMLIEIDKNPAESQIHHEGRMTTFNFLSEDRKWRVSLAASSLTLTGREYTDWETFFPRLEDAFKKFKDIYSIPLVSRFGLRYRNLINKEELGLKNENWNNLIKDGVIGHLTNKEFFEGEIDDTDILASINAIQLKLEELSLILQTGFTNIEGSDKKGFFIDADHYNAKNISINDVNLEREFNVLHKQSGYTFRNCLEETLYNALKTTK